MPTTRNQNHDHDASSSSKRPKTCAPWSDLDPDLLYLVMKLLGVVDYLSFGGVCKSWRSLAISNRNKFMVSKPPMTMHFSWSTYKRACYLKDFEGRKFKTLLPWFSVVNDCIGLTCGYLIFFKKATRDFWLVNPITRKVLHFPRFPNNFSHGRPEDKAILVFSPSISEWVFIVLYKSELWYSIEGKGTWNHASHTFHINDLYAFNGKLYALISDNLYFPLYERFRLCEVGLNPEPKFTLLETKNPIGCEFFYPRAFGRSYEKLSVIGWAPDNPYILRELDFGQMKWTPHEQTMGEYAFFRSDLNRVFVALRREPWADPSSLSHGRFADTDKNGRIIFITNKMWYFPHECMNVDRIDK